MHELAEWGNFYAVVARRMKKQAVYKPGFEDWLFHFWLPLGAYALLALAPFAAPYGKRTTLFGVGASVLLLLFIGVHNFWDAVAYHVFVVWPKSEAARQRNAASEVDRAD